LLSSQLLIAGAAASAALLMQSQRVVISSSGGHAAPHPPLLAMLPAPSQPRPRLVSLVPHSCRPSTFGADAPPCERRRLWQYSAASGGEPHRIRRCGGDRVLLQRSSASSAWRPGDSSFDAGATCARVDEAYARAHDTTFADCHVPLTFLRPLFTQDAVDHRVLLLCAHEFDSDRAPPPRAQQSTCVLRRRRSGAGSCRRLRAPAGHA